MPAVTRPRFDLIQRDVARAFERAAARLNDFLWAMAHRAPNDVEKLAFSLAVRHVREGRTDLAVEDLTWLGRRLEGS